MSTRLRAAIAPAVILAMFLAAWLALPSLPARIPTHWNADGVVDGYGPPWMAFLMPAMALFVYALLWAIPYLDPNRKNVLEFYKRHGFGFKLVMVAFFAVMQWAMLAAALGQRVDMAPLVSLCIGALFAYMGWIMRDIKRNYFIGFRTPWALADERNWSRTHAYGGKVFMALGALVAALTLLGFSMLWWVLAMGVGVASIAVYSYLQFRRR